MALSAALALLAASFVVWRYPVSSPPAASRPAHTAARAATYRRLELLEVSEQAKSALAGHVYAGNTPIEGALVCAACLDCEATAAKPSPCTTSDADGLYAFFELTPGGYFLNATAAGFTPATANGGEPVFVDPQQTRQSIDIALTPGGAELTGSVVDATGGPIAGAHVRAVRLMPPRMSLDTRSDADGRFVFALNPGFIQVVAEAEGYARASVRATAPSDVELRLVPGSSVDGRVVMWGSEAPVANVEVKAISARTPQPALAPSDVTDAAGRFRVSGLEPGRYMLDARGDRTRSVPGQALELGVAEHRGEVVVEVRQASEVHGFVSIEGEQRPCQQGTVALGDPSPLQPLPSEQEMARITGGAAIERASGPGHRASIRADGSVHFPGVPPGYYFARVECRGHQYHSGPRLLKVGLEPVQDVEWGVVPAAQAVVHVVDERGEPVARTDVYLELPSRGARVVSSHRTGAQGSVTIEGLSPGSYKLHAPDGYDGVEPITFVVQPGAPDVELTLRLPGSGFVLVHVEDEHAQPVDGLWLKAVREADDQSGAPGGGTEPQEVPAQAMGAGAYRIGPLTEGTYDIALLDGINPPIERGATPETRVMVTPGAMVEAHVRVLRGGTISGQVLDARGTPAPDVWVTVLPGVAPKTLGAMRAVVAAQATPRRVLSDTQGRFSIDGLSPDASFRLRASEPQGSSAVLADVRPGDDVAIRLPQTATLSGVAVDPDGQPVTQFRVRAIHPELGTQQSHAFADPGGRFSLTNVAPGKVQLAVLGPRGGNATAALEVAPGERLSDLRLQLRSGGPGLHQRAGEVAP